MGKTLTAPLAIIKAGGVTIGKLRNIRVSENIRRGRVVGLGNINPSELPVLEWSGTCNASQYAIKYDENDALAKLALNRKFSSVESFVQNLLFDEGVDICIFTRTKSGATPPAYGEENFVTIPGCVITSEGIDVSEGQIGGRDISFEYKQPYLYAPTT